ncbi:hypothetical protein [Streptomyces sp. C8S0]|uniref:hypothetical protein n=1 Tax=Streptomyces sp. C8S0 TaxID=2585716 RepID=UPI001D05356D|nr:hypothetical protein [Streptomyces sp. C8S0]
MAKTSWRIPITSRQHEHDPPLAPERRSPHAELHHPRARTSRPLPTTVWFPNPDEPNVAPIPGAVLPAWAIDKIRTEFVGRPAHRPTPLLKIAIRDTAPAWTPASRPLPSPPRATTRRARRRGRPCSSPNSTPTPSRSH